MFTSVNFHNAERIKITRTQQGAGGCHVLEFAVYQTIGGEENRLEVTVFSDRPLSIDDPRGE